VLDLVDLQLISEVLTSVNLPVGKYTKIALYYENPVVTVGGVETTDVQTTANGRIFISQNFIVPDTGPVLIQIDFKEIGLTETGNSGKYVLNPQLRVDISIETALVEFAGTILSITPEPQSISVDSGTTILDVAVNDGTEIVRQQEVAPPVVEEPPALADFVEVEVPFGDLMIGDKVEVDGVLQLDGTIEADRIEVVPPLLLPVEPEVPVEPPV
jgi:hypothetical protein